MFKDGATAQKKIRPLAQKLITEKRPGDYNQAIMELKPRFAIVKAHFVRSVPYYLFVLLANREIQKNFRKLGKKRRAKKRLPDFGLCLHLVFYFKNQKKKVNAWLEFMNYLGNRKISLF